jgi:hypothetical protein
VDEDAEPSPSAVARSIKSRDDEAMGGCASMSEAGAREDAEGVVLSWLLRPLCACET